MAGYELIVGPFSVLVAQSKATKVPTIALGVVLMIVGLIAFGLFVLVVVLAR